MDCSVRAVQAYGQRTVHNDSKRSLKRKKNSGDFSVRFPQIAAETPLHLPMGFGSRLDGV